MTLAIVISRYQAQPLLQARLAGQNRVTVSLDLGLSQAEVTLTTAHAEFPSGERLTWDEIERIAGDEAGCYVVEGSTCRKIHVFSSATQRPYSLMATAGAPTLINSGFTMHRIVAIDPHEDTLRKIRALAPLRGEVLDTVTGLGYTAIEAARTADHVLTIELDPAVLEIARLNPWSRTLFDNPRITQIVGDTFEEIQRLDDERFACIMHDPPSLSLAGELYSGAYYRQLHRVLQGRGRLFHYIGNLASAQGHKVATGAIKRLYEAGFTRVTKNASAFGLVAVR